MPIRAISPTLRPFGRNRGWQMSHSRTLFVDILLRISYFILNPLAGA